MPNREATFIPITPPEGAEQREAYEKDAAARMVNQLRGAGRGGRGKMRDLVREHFTDIIRSPLTEQDAQQRDDLLEILKVGIRSTDVSKQQHEAKDAMDEAITTVHNHELKSAFIRVYVDEYLEEDPASVIVMLAAANLAELPLTAVGESGDIIPHSDDRNREEFVTRYYGKVKNPKDKWRIANAMVSRRHLLVPKDHESYEERKRNTAKWLREEKKAFVPYAESVLEENRTAQDEWDDTDLEVIFDRMRNRKADGFEADNLSNLAGRISRRVLVRDMATDNVGSARSHARDIGMSEEFIDALAAIPASRLLPRQAGERAGHIFDQWRESEQQVFPTPDSSSRGAGN